MARAGSKPEQPKDAEKPRGLECPRCGCGHFEVVYTRQVAKGRVMRRRECRHCGRRLTTFEQIAGSAE